MKFPTDNFGRALKMLREIYVVDIKELANYADISVSTITRVERGAVGPSINTFNELINYYEINYKKMVDVAFNRKKLSNAKLLLSMQPGKSSEKIDPKFSCARVAKLVRILKDIPFNYASTNDTKVRTRLSRSAVNDIESFLHNPNILTTEHFCELYEISIDKFFYFAKKTADMTTIDAGLLMAIDLES